MKRLGSILLLTIFLFNLGGYYLVFWGMEVQAKKNLLQRLEAESYSSDELVVLTIPVSLPYAMNDADYQPVEGEFMHNGQYYKLVRQKYENDSLFIVCIKDASTASISKKLTDYSKVANNLPVGEKESLNFLAKLYKDYKSSEFDYVYLSKYIFTRSYIAFGGEDVLMRPSVIESPPPEIHS